jgi:hypothetical protein
VATENDRDGLDLDDEEKFLERSWLIQRIGWVVMIIIVVAAIIGLFGGGPVSSASAGTLDSGLEIRYERFARMHAVTEARVRAAHAAPGDSMIAVWVSERWIGRFDVQSINPEPARTSVRGRGRTYEFVAADTSSVEIILELRPTKMGPTTGMISLIGGPSVPIRQFIYP